MFEQATRMKLRFTTPQGQLTVEDLWDLPLTSTTNRANLDAIAVGLYTELNNGAGMSFVSASTPKNAEIELKFAIVKHIIDVKKTENAAKVDAQARKQQREQLLQLIDQKEKEQLGSKSIEELRQMAEKL